DVLCATVNRAGQKCAVLTALKNKQHLRLRRYAHRIIAKQYRHHRVHRVFVEDMNRDGGADSDHKGDSDDSDDQIIRAFNRLSYGEQDFLAFIAWDSFTPGDAARILNLSLGAFTLRLSKARTQLGRRYRREQRRSDRSLSSKRFSV